MLSYFFLNDTATSEIYTYCHTLSRHDILPNSAHGTAAAVGLHRQIRDHRRGAAGGRRRADELDADRADHRLRPRDDDRDDARRHRPVVDAGRVRAGALQPRRGRAGRAAAGGLPSAEAGGGAGDGLSRGSIGGAARSGRLCRRCGQCGRGGAAVKRFVPFPLLALALFAMWILLTGFSPGHVLLGALVALIVSQSMLSLQVEPPRVRIGWAVVRLSGIVLADIVRSNIEIGRAHV